MCGRWTSVCLSCRQYTFYSVQAVGVAKTFQT